MDTRRIEDWIGRYRDAWSTDDPTLVARLFTPNVRYFTAPYAEPLEGIEAVTRYWMGEAEAGIDWTFDHEVAAREDDLFVVRAVTTYPEGTRDAGGAREVFHNLWLVTLDGEGRAGEFVEFYMLAPDEG